MIATFKQLIRDESGATAIEYGLIAALVSVAAIGALTTMGESLTEIFGVVSTKLEEAAASAQTPTE
jgi:pilus assembly protein Flp/PilA